MFKCELISRFGIEIVYTLQYTLVVIQPTNQVHKRVEQMPGKKLIDIKRKRKLK